MTNALIFFNKFEWPLLFKNQRVPTEKKEKKRKDKYQNFWLAM